jgi:elongation factor 1-beta
MTNVIVTLKLMPSSPEVDLNALQEEVKKHILEFAGEGEIKVTEEPVAFGLKSLNIIFIMDESLGSPDALEETIKGVEGVQSVEVTDVRRAIG